MADIAQLGIEIDTRKLKSGEKDLASFASSASSAERTVSRATTAITGMIAALSVQKIISAADSFSMLEARVSRFTDSASDTASVMNKLTQYANASGSAMRDTAGVFVQLSSSAEDLGKSQDQVLEFTRLINEIGYYGGSSSDELSNALRQMSQSFSGGIVRAEEFNSVIENTPEIARTIASGMGISMGQLRQEMLAGKLTAEAVFDAILSQGGNVDALFAKMPRTVSAAMQTMENELTTLVGRLNQSEGATGGLASGIDALSDVIRSASEHTEAIVTVTEALAAVYASKLIASIGGAISAKIKDVAATTAQTKAIAAETQAVAASATAQARRAAANVSVSESAVTAARMDLALAQAATAAGTAEMSLAKAEINSAKTTLSLLESERALEAQRLKAQITDQGRIATYTRMAEIEKAMQVTKASLSKAEIAYSESVAAATAKETAAKEALIVAESQLRNAKLAKTEATIAETAAQNIASASARAASVSITALKGAMSLVGGPAGVAMLAATAIYYFYQKSQEAAQQALEFASSVDTTTQALRSMTPVAAAAANAKLAVALQEQEESAADLRDELQALEDKYRSGTSASGNYQLSQSQLADLQNQIAIKAGEVEEAENKVSQTRSKQHAITALLNGNLKDNYVAMQNSNSVTGIASGIQSVFNGVLNTGNKLLQQRNNYVMLGNGAKSNLTATDQKYLTQLENEIALEKELDPIKRARIKAEQEAAAQGLSASGTTQYINQSVKLAEIQAKNDAASKSLTASYKSESAAAANATKQINSEIIALEFRVATIGKTEAQIALYKLATEGATKAQLEHTKTLLNQLSAYDAQIKKQQDAISSAERYNQMMRQYDELITGAKSGTTEYGQTLHDLNVLLAEGKINQQEYNAAVGRLNTKYAEAGKSAVDWSKIQEDAINAGKDALAEFLYDPLDGGFEGMVSSFTSALRQMAAQAAAAQLMQSMFGGTGGGSSAMGGLIGSIGSAFSSFDGGGYTGNGSRSGGLDGKGGFWAMMHPQETVIDHTKSGVDNSRTVNTSSESNSNTRNTVINLSQTINTTGKIDNRTSKQIAADTYRKQRLAQRRLGA